MQIYKNNQSLFFLKKKINDSLGFVKIVSSKLMAVISMVETSVRTQVDLCDFFLNVKRKRGSDCEL